MTVFPDSAPISAAHPDAGSRSLLGLSTYAYFWQWSERNPAALSLEEMLRDAAGHGAEVFQICDYPALDAMSSEELVAVRNAAQELKLVLEVGTRGVRPEKLRQYLEIAQQLGAGFVRSMVRPTDTPIAEVPDLLASVLPEYAEAEISLGLETYEQLPTTDLVALVERTDHPRLGIVLDPGNSVAALEHPADVVRRTAARVNNLHIKDFAFSRQDGWVGFVYTGTRLGEGLLDYDAMVSAVEPHQRGVNQIIEHWLPWQGDIERTIRAEQDWIHHNITYLRSKNS